MAQLTREQAKARVFNQTAPKTKQQGTVETAAKSLDQSFFQKQFVEGGGLEQVRQFGKGVAKGALSTIRGASSLGERGLRGTVGRFFGQDPSAETSAEQLIPQRLITANTTAERIGFGAEQIAEFLIPGFAATKLSKAVKVASKTGKVLRLGANVSGKTGKALRLGARVVGKTGKVSSLGTKVATEAGIVGGQRALQKGKVDDDVRTAALTAGLFSLAGSGLGALRRSLKPVGEKIQTTVIKPTNADFKDGFKIENVNKHKLGGSLEQTLTKTEQKLNSLSGKLTASLKGQPKRKVDIFTVYDDTARDILQKTKTRQFGNVKATRRVLKNLEDEIFEQTEDGLVNLIDATNIKRGAGKKGAWVFGSADPDASATEAIYTKFYQNLNNKINKIAPNKVKDLNRQISELIPISNAVIRRIPVEARNQALSLTDQMGLYASVFDPRALALIGANRLSKSGKFGQFLINVAENTPKSILGQRFIGS